MKRKIGILGGTFNPIHNGHILLGKKALSELKLDQIWIMPSGQTNLKKDLYILPKEERQKLVELAIEDYPDFFLSDIELNRPGITYTYETLMELKTLYPEDEFYFILGADCLFSIEKWMKPEIIMSHAVLASATRGEKDLEDLKAKSEYLAKKFDAKIILLPFSKIDISSSEIRDKINKDESIDHLVPKKVLEYINKNHLYKEKHKL